MANIWVPSKCEVCGKLIGPGNKTAIFEGEVKTTAAESYQTQKKGRWSQKINFFPGSDRKLTHLKCAGKMLNGVNVIKEIRAILNILEDDPNFDTSTTVFKENSTDNFFNLLSLLKRIEGDTDE